MLNKNEDTQLTSAFSSYSSYGSLHVILRGTRILGLSIMILYDRKRGAASVRRKLVLRRATLGDP